MHGILILVRKEFLIEIRRRSSVAGIFLYLLSAVFVTYLAFGRIISFDVWNALFWIINLFSIVNVAAGSFSAEPSGRMLYYYTLSSPRSIILSKLVYNLMMAVVTSMTGLVVFILFFGGEEVPFLLYAIGILLGSSGFACIVTMMSALAAPSGGSSSLVSVLSFPLMLPMLISAIKASRIVIESGFSVNLLLYWIVLLLLIVITGYLAVLLFPFLWKE